MRTPHLQNHKPKKKEGGDQHQQGLWEPEVRCADAYTEEEGAAAKAGAIFSECSGVRGARASAGSGGGGSVSVSDGGGEERWVFGELEREMREGARGQASGRLVDKVCGRSRTDRGGQRPSGEAAGGAFRFTWA
jgi:hypothetical protein